jgi:uncharacterized membrane protein
MQAVALLAATLTAGLMAGVYGIFALAIMPGLRATDDRTFVAAFQAIDRAIVNPLFMLWFFGPLLFAGVAAVLVGGDVLPWIAAALVLSLAVVVITFAVHLPLNDAIKAAATGPEARGPFNEARWVAWNLVRAVLSTTAFGCLAWALVEYGRA